MLRAGEDVIKYGVRIARATKDRAGMVHLLHNIRSVYDERSSHLDVMTGRPEIPDMSRRRAMDNLKREYSWMGYVRKNGAMGIRNKVLVIYTVSARPLWPGNRRKTCRDPRQRWSDFGLYG